MEKIVKKNNLALEIMLNFLLYVFAWFLSVNIVNNMTIEILTIDTLLSSSYMRQIIAITSIQLFVGALVHGLKLEKMPQLVYVNIACILYSLIIFAGFMAISEHSKIALYLLVIYLGLCVLFQNMLWAIFLNRRIEEGISEICVKIIKNTFSRKIQSRIFMFKGGRFFSNSNVYFYSVIVALVACSIFDILEMHLLADLVISLGFILLIIGVYLSFVSIEKKKQL